MPSFTYKAKKTDGAEYDGTFDGVDRFALFHHIREEGGTVVSFEEKGGEKRRAFHVNLESINAFLSRVREHDKISLARNLGAMLSAGLSVSRALEILDRQMRHPALRRVFGHLQGSISAGKTLHEGLSAFPRVFPPLFIAMVRAGEESGGLAQALALISTQMEQTYLLKKRIRGAMMYPTIVLCAMVAVGAAMMVYVVPTLSDTFRELKVELPTSTRIIIGISDFMKAHYLLAFGGAVAAIVGFFALLRTRLGRRAKEIVLLYTPIIRPLVQETNAARVARTLSSLLSAGVAITHAFEITADVVQHSSFRAVLVEAEGRIQKGTSIADVFRAAEHLYPPFVSEMIAVGEETGDLSAMLVRVADFYEEEVSRKTKDMSTVIEPFLMVTIGAGVGFFAVSMIQPIYSLSSAI
ncbi:MAG: type II secretion system F family protein [bacterium]|nr:type II secretion system F family protein [bacterium]MDZ4284570.1 type II secretion system F family protein [Patescibacteria group bacterium]